MFSKQKPSFRGFTLVELLVVIAIIGILIALLLPAIQAAREAARRAQCANHIKQMSVAFHCHAAAHKSYPSGGWSWCWTGDPDYGLGTSQCGGWCYSILPFIEQEAVFDMGRGLSDVEKEDAFLQTATTAIPTFYCPSRRQAKPSVPKKYFGAYQAQLDRTKLKDSTGNSRPVAKTDYAACAGDPEQIDDDTNDDMPGNLKDHPNEPDENVSLETHRTYNWQNSHMRGIVFQHSAVKPGHVVDGTSNTYLVGEKYLSILAYDGCYITGTAQDKGDNECVYNGYNRDTIRSTHPLNPPKQDAAAVEQYSFGSAHPGGFHMGFGDGSVRYLPFDIDAQVHQYLGVRDDGRSVRKP